MAELRKLLNTPDQGSPLTNKEQRPSSHERAPNRHLAGPCCERRDPPPDHIGNRGLLQTQLRCATEYLNRHRTRAAPSHHRQHTGLPLPKFSQSLSDRQKLSDRDNAPMHEIPGGGIHLRVCGLSKTPHRVLGTRETFPWPCSLIKSRSSVIFIALWGENDGTSESALGTADACRSAWWRYPRAPALPAPIEDQPRARAGDWRTSVSRYAATPLPECEPVE